MAAALDTPALVAEGLSYTYEGGYVGLDGLSLTVRAGRRLAVVGPNGAGKTTLLLHLNGTLRPGAGRVLVGGAPGTYSRQGLTAWRQVVGLVFQNPDDQLFAGTVAQDVSFGPLNLGLSEAETRARVADALRALDIEALRDRPTHMLSFGQKKRAAIAGAVAMRPEVLVIDEPLAGLDPSGAEHLLDVLGRLHAAGTTLILATHDMALAYEWADDVAVLRSGRIVAQGEAPLVLAEAALLRESGLRVPWVLEVSEALRAAGVLPADGPGPRSRGELAAALAALPPSGNQA
ncbi:MAG: ATP-binding cassette domain-containing protein, partial [Thermoleophilia bacterium]